MAVTSIEANGLTATEVRCPNPGCTRTFTCDACLHAHLVRRYNVRYAEAFGRTPHAYLDFCDEHVGTPPSMLGL